MFDDNSRLESLPPPPFKLGCTTSWRIATKTLHSSFPADLVAPPPSAAPAGESRIFFRYRFSSRYATTFLVLRGEGVIILLTSLAPRMGSLFSTYGFDNEYL